MVKILMADVSPLMRSDVFESCMQHLPEARLQKVNRIKNTEDKCLSAGAWLLLNEGAKYIDKNADTANIEVQKGGKPYLKNSPYIHFSLSHSHTVAMCAVSTEKIGADIQQVCDFKEEICSRHFAPGELGFVMAASSAQEKKDRFFEIWTLKEAYSKMTGKGISDFLNFEVDPEKKICLNRSNGLTDAHFYTFTMPRYKAAVCTEGEITPEFENVNLLQLIK